jgi:hypothetical protein
MDTMEKAAVRGSAVISDEMFARPSEVSKAALKQLIKIARSKGVTVEGWWTHGKPAIDVINGVLHVKPEMAGDIFRQLKVEGFPIGIINPELIEIRFSTPGGR